MTTFNAEEYWGKREVKVWVVYLSGPGKRPQRDIKYIRARTEQGAIKTARFWSSLKRISYAHARLAEPQDLGCTYGPGRLVPRGEAA